MQGTNENIDNKLKVMSSLKNAVIVIYIESYMSRWKKNKCVRAAEVLKQLKTEFTFERQEENI